MLHQQYIVRYNYIVRLYLFFLQLQKYQILLHRFRKNKMVTNKFKICQDPQSRKIFQKSRSYKRATYVEFCGWLYLSLIDTENSVPVSPRFGGGCCTGWEGGGFVASIYRLIKGDTWPTRRPFLFPATDRKPPHPLIFDALVVLGASLNWNFLDSAPCCSIEGRGVPWFRLSLIYFVSNCCRVFGGVIPRYR